MIPEIVFRFATVCPDCGSGLKAYRTDRRRVVSWEIGEFTAVHKIMRCDHSGIIFRSERLESLIGSRCTYANDIMLESAMKRFIHGRSCSEISDESGTGISERHTRRLTNDALGIFQKIHEETSDKIRAAMSSWILQIDGTTDSEFDMIIVVMDSESGFVLHVKRCHAESEAEILGILRTVRERFGIPSGTISDMRPGILSAIGKVFPGVPRRICLFHFLRDLGKDLMESMHLDLGRMINSAGIKNPLKNLLRSIPGYDQRTLHELDYGFCSDRETMEIMALRRILSHAMDTTGSSGYGFPFSLKHLNFFLSCRAAMDRLNALTPRLQSKRAKDLAGNISSLMGRIVKSQEISDMADRIGGINAVFQSVRKAFRIPERGKLSQEPRDDPEIRMECDILMGQLECILKAAETTQHEKNAIKIVLQRYRSRVEMLFANNAQGTMPRTNNRMERFFRSMRRNIRKRSGNMATGRYLALNGERIALFQNMSNDKYRRIVFGNADIPAVFGRYRTRTKNTGMRKCQMARLVDMGMEKMLSDSLPDTPLTEENMEKFYSDRNGQSNAQCPP